MTPLRPDSGPESPRFYRLSDVGAYALPSRAPMDEQSLQRLIEANARMFLGVYPLASNYQLSTSSRGRADTIGIDDDARPAIVEYKRTVTPAIISQGLFYLDQLLDHKAEFQMLLEEKLGVVSPGSIRWRNARIIFVAPDFHPHDLRSIHHVRPRLEFIRYRLFGSESLMLEEVTRR